MRKKSNNKSFSKSQIIKDILLVFKQNSARKLNYKQISKLLSIKDMGTKIILVEALEDLANENFIKVVSRGSYRYIHKKTTIIGIVKNTNSKGVFVIYDTDKEVFVDKSESKFALRGDEVSVLITPKNKKKLSGSIEEVLKRSKNSFIGRIVKEETFGFFIADDYRIYFDVFLPKKEILGDFKNKKVHVEILQWDSSKKNPVGKIISVLGDANNHDVEMSSILINNGLDTSYPQKILNDVKLLQDKHTEKDLKNRLDLRGKPTFTIDPEDAKDFDDALSFENLKNGNYSIGVHIADVSHYVKEETSLDKESVRRATSIYLVDRVIPMLPEKLSNDLCSLKPNVDRLSFSVLFEINKDAKIINYNITESVIHSDKRFTYSDAQETINSKKGIFFEELILLNNLSKILREKRRKNGSINFEKSEVKFILDEHKNPINVYFKESLETNKLIEEFMLLANKTVAKHLEGKKIPFVYRVHDKPNENKINDLKNIVKTFGYSIESSNSYSLSKSLNQLLSQSQGKAEEQMIETLTIRSMAKAVYTTKNIGHYGLAFDHYSHFTSPIRRYPDLLVHRILKNYIKQEKSIDISSLEKLCKHSSDMEKMASSAERESIKFMQTKYLKNKIGESFSGVISGVTDWGFYVELDKNKCEGLVKISTIKNDYFIYDEKTQSLIGKSSKKRYQLGQKVTIKISNADLEKKQLDFILS
jgi:ribonuclease R|tara:strand:- start:127 stop:2235 length:2109 start_codon:yes stop_codon:yes gene_type:complete